MNWNSFYNIIKNQHPALTLEDFKILTHNKVSNIQLSRWVTKKLLVKFRRNVYVLPENININSFVMANKAFEPSYISLESALFYYGLIPDIVVAVTSVTAKKTRRFEFNNKLFIYQKIKSDLFLGYQEIKDVNWSFLIALPEKAVLDYFYLHQGELNDQDAWEELRINHEMYVKQIKKNKLFKLCKFFNNPKLTKLIKEFDEYIRKEYASI